MSSLSEFLPNITPGHIRYFATNQVDSAYLKCDGSVVLQSSYPALYNQIGLIQEKYSLDNWGQADPRPYDNLLTAVYGGGIYIIAGQYGKLYTSANAEVWTSRTSGTSNNIYALTYGTSYVYAGNVGTLATSTDGSSWTTRSSGTSNDINALTFGNGIYVYAGNVGVLATSTDAVTWSPQTSGTSSNIYALTFGNGLFVYGGHGGVLATSTNAINWTTRSSGTSNNIYALTYGNGIYVYGGSRIGATTTRPNLATSADAITWTARNVGSSIYGDIKKLTYAEGKYLATVYYTASGGDLLTSTNLGVTWAASDFFTGPPSALTYGNGIFVLGTETFGYIYYAYTNPYNYNSSTEFILPDSTKLLEDFNVVNSNITANQSVYIKAI